MPPIPHSRDTHATYGGHLSEGDTYFSRDHGRDARATSQISLTVRLNALKHSTIQCAPLSLGSQGRAERTWGRGTLFVRQLR